MDVRLLASTYALICVAEVPGKTTFASFLLASRAKPGPVYAGAAAAFVVHSAIAVAAGSIIGLLPARLVQIFAGILFLALAAMMWRQSPEEAPEREIAAPTGFAATAAAAFGLIFVAQ